MINKCHYPQDHCSSSEEKMPEAKEWAEVQMPFYNLSLGEEEKVEEPVLKLTAGDSGSCSEPTDQAIKEKKVTVPELGRS